MFQKMTPQRALALSWPLLRRLPGGGALLGMAIGRAVPYTGNVRPKVLGLAPGYAQIGMGDGPLVRNHLRSLHAMALGNLAEFTSAVAILYGLPDDLQAILTRITIDYTKKARGEVVATARLSPPQAVGDYEVPITITNAEGQEVVRAVALWKVGPARAPR
jgi:acyl-coenzyme A thioesterase PaaI-like protein